MSEFLIDDPKLEAVAIQAITDFTVQRSKLVPDLRKPPLAHLVEPPKLSRWQRLVQWWRRR